MCSRELRNISHLYSKQLYLAVVKSSETNTRSRDRDERQNQTKTWFRITFGGSLILGGEWKHPG